MDLTNKKSCIIDFKLTIINNILELYRLLPLYDSSRKIESYKINNNNLVKILYFPRFYIYNEIQNKSSLNIKNFTYVKSKNISNIPIHHNIDYHEIASIFTTEWIN